MVSAAAEVHPSLPLQNPATSQPMRRRSKEEDSFSPSSLSSSIFCLTVTALEERGGDEASDRQKEVDSVQSPGGEQGRKRRQDGKVNGG